jgi:hypothetical protein
MIERDYRVRFLLKALQALRIPGEAHGQKFERGHAARCHVAGQINFAHPATAYPFGNLVVTECLTDEQVSLPISNNARRNADSWGFNEVAYSLTRSEKPFNFAAQNLIAFARRFQKSSNVVRVLLQRCVKDFLNRL